MEYIQYNFLHIICYPFYLDLAIIYSKCMHVDAVSKVLDEIDISHELSPLAGEVYLILYAVQGLKGEDF